MEYNLELLNNNLLEQTATVSSLPSHYPVMK